MNRYFDFFPVINYNNSTMINIMDRTAILNSVIGDVYAFYPYHVKNGMRPEVVAERYYGDSDLVWLVYFSNNIVDPYHDWPMDDDTFNAFIVEQYGSSETAIQTIVNYRINWFEDNRSLTQSEYDNLLPNEKKYWTPQFDFNNRPQAWIRKELDINAVATDAEGNVTLSVPSTETTYWVAVTAMDAALEENAKKANIRLLDSRLAPVAIANISALLSE